MSFRSLPEPRGDFFRVTGRVDHDRLSIASEADPTDLLTLDLRESGSWKAGELDGRSVLWSAPMPKGSDDRIRQFVSMITYDPNAYWKSAALTFVRSVTDGVATVALIEAPQPAADGTMLSVAPEEIDTPLFTGELHIRLPEGASVQPGDALMTCEHGCRVKDGAVETAVKHLVNLGRFESEDAVRGFLPEPPKAGWGLDRGTGRVALMSAGEFEREHERAYARLEPDVALVYWERDERGQASSYILGSMGVVLFEADSLSDDVYGDDVEPGLWVMVDPKWWSSQSYEGEWDGGLDHDWRPATLADLDLFGLDLESVAKKIEGQIERDFTAAQVAEAMAAAERAAEASMITTAELTAEREEQAMGGTLGL